MKRIISLIIVLAIFLNNAAFCNADNSDDVFEYAEELFSYYPLLFEIPFLDSDTKEQKESEKESAIKDRLSDVWGSITDAAETAVEGACATLDAGREFAVTAASVVAEKAEDAYTAVSHWVQTLSWDDFSDGWDKASSFLGSTYASVVGAEYVAGVATAIDQLQIEINNRVSSNSTIASAAGYLAEEWHAGTFNIDAIAKGIGKYARTDKSNGLGSADVSVGDEISASLKYYAFAEESAKQQAKSIYQRYREYIAQNYRNSDNVPTIEEWLSKNGINPDEYSDFYWTLYGEQIRVIPSDQIAAAKVFLKKAIAKERLKGGGRNQIARNYQKTLETISDRIQSSDGIESIPLSKEEAETIAKVAKDNDFKPSDFGITTSSAIKGTYVVKQAFKGGTSAAVIQAAMAVGPEIIEIIKELGASGELDIDLLKETGVNGLTAGADGFLKGSISSSLIILCKAGKLGSEFTNASPQVIGAMTVLIVDAIRYGMMMANGNITSEEYTDLIAEEFIVSSGSLATAAVVSMLFPGASLAICLGSFVGGVLASAAYDSGKTYVLALIENGGADMLVPVSEASELIKNTAASVETTLSAVIDDIDAFKDEAIANVKYRLFMFV